MSEFKGTPGPWSVEGSWVESDCRYIAEVHDFREECEIFKPVHPESAANANLIAAAPELLDLVQRANGKNGCHTVAWQEKAKEVLVKALGQ